MLSCNVGNTDRLLRLVVGTAIITLGAYYQNMWGLVGLIPITTALLRWCPAYLPFGIKSK